MKTVKDTISTKEICDIMQVRSPYDYNEYIIGDWALDANGDYTEEYESACSKYASAWMNVANKLFKEHKLQLFPNNPSYVEDDDVFVVRPASTWNDACSEIIETINGVGMFYFGSVEDLVESGPYDNEEQACLNHLHWMKEHHRVYGDPSPQYQIDRAMKY
jgi:hypothetical protein